MIARVAVKAAVYAIDTPFSYRVPAGLESAARPGVRVTVPFGRGNRPTEGVLLALEEGDGEKLKSVTQVLDATPVLDDSMLRLAAFMRDRYFCTMYDAARAMLPAGLWYRETRIYCLSPNYDPAVTAAVPESPEETVLRHIEAAGGSMEAGALEAAFGGDPDKPLGRLLTAGLITAQGDVQSVPGKSEEFAELAVSAEDALTAAVKKKRSAPLQAAVLEFLAMAGKSCVKEIRYYTGANARVLRRLETLGVITRSRRAVFRRPEIAVPKEPQPMTPGPEQQAVIEGMAAQMEEKSPGVALLYGVTGSGKTAVYLDLIRRTLQRGKSAMLLVPEIALTPQLLRLFTSHLGDRVAALHSGLRIGERYDEWKRIREGAATVVIGTRSAVFAPLLNPGLFIVDEEQEHTYKSEASPRYHAREVAIYRGDRAGALVILGSATPSIESMYRAKTGVYRQYTIRNRYNGARLPPAVVADRKEDLRAGNGGAIGGVLRGELEQNLANGRQSILFINRRGNSRLLMCTACGYVPRCDRCSVNLTWHSANGRLMCHYCGHSETVPDRCPECGGRLRPVGAGTLKVQRELETLFPGVKVLRMDTDTITAVNTHEAMLSRFETEEIPILVGTQMVAKGLNLPNVTLVGVLDADMALYVDDFRASENTFDLITQVVGRAGRGDCPGRAVIQTLTPENRTIRLAARQDYEGFYEQEAALRAGRNAPPYCDLITFAFSGLEEELVQRGAYRFRQRLTAALSGFDPAGGAEVLGPAPMAVARVNLRYRYRLTLTVQNSRPVRQLCAALLKEFLKMKENRGVSVWADVNAYEPI